jgi:hypothetical protein
MAEVISLSRPANPDEVATIAAAGHRFADGPMPGPRFRFTTAERESDPPPFDWHTLRLKPPTSMHV